MSTHRERFELARAQYTKALQRLHEALELDETSIVRDALIQRFEFCYELAWKSMFYWLRDQGERVPEMVRPVLEAAFRGGLIEDAEGWAKIKQYRDETSHTYDEAKAIEVSAYVRGSAIHTMDVYSETLKTR